MRKPLWYVLVLALVLVLAAGCTAAAPAPAAPEAGADSRNRLPTQAQAESRSQCASRRYPSQARSTPTLPRTSTRLRPIEQLFLGLTNLNNETGEVEPELAESWTVSDDGLVWTFQHAPRRSVERRHPGNGQ